MLFRLDQKKLQYKQHILYGNVQQPFAVPNSRTGDIENDLPKITIRKLIDQYCETKITIEKEWKNPDTIKGKKEYLARVAEMFDYVAKKKNPVISSLTREHAREMRRVLSLIPANLKKKYPTLTLRQVIKKSESGIIPEVERLKPNSINTFAGPNRGYFYCRSATVPFATF